MVLKRVLLLAALVWFTFDSSWSVSLIQFSLFQALTTNAQFYDYSALQNNVNGIASSAEKELQSIRSSISEYLLTTTDDMISYATNSLAEGGNDPKAPMIGACTLYPTNYLNHYTKEINGKVAEAQAQVNAMKFAVLKSLINQPMISEPDATYVTVQEQLQTLTNGWPTIKATLDAEMTAYMVKVNQLVLDMQECIQIAEE